MRNRVLGMLIVLLLSSTTTLSQENNVERPFYTTAELYKSVEGEELMKFYKFENEMGILKFTITDSTVKRERSEAYSPVKIERKTFKIVSKERVEYNINGKSLTKVSYTLSDNGSIYYFQYYEGHLDEIMWQTPSGILKLITGNVIIDLKE